MVSSDYNFTILSTKKIGNEGGFPFVRALTKKDTWCYPCNESCGKRLLDKYNLGMIVKVAYMKERQSEEYHTEAIGI